MWPLEGVSCAGRRVLFLIFEASLLFGTIVSGFACINWVLTGRAAVDGRAVALAAGLAGLCQLAFYYADLYGPSDRGPRLPFVERLFRALGVVAIVTALGSSGVPFLDDHAPALLVALALPLLVVPVGRHQYPTLIKFTGLPHRVLVVGDGPAADAIRTEIGARQELGYEVVGSLTLDPDPKEPTSPRGGAALAGLPVMVEDERVDIVTVALEDGREPPLAALLACRSAGAMVVQANRFYERVTGRILLERLTPSALIYGGTPPRRIAVAIKRTIDVVVSAILLVFLAPVLALVALLIRVDSPGPIFYTQERVGFRGRPFTIYKFRSMRADAEVETGPVWAAGDDARVTRVGRFLRACRLDECPQLWNVLKGDMSVVGPRPERPVFVERLRLGVPYYEQRHLLKPGVTGWAQVCYPYGASVEDARMKLSYDLYYLLNWSTVFDLLIIFHTIKIVLCGRGAR
jgi:sugar transferase (PEP-CTERM system associated)